ncbi:MAG: tetratricopeptide repeat protein [Deltaproteobacteria bacterium]|nr:tetratricopeptide repeat protein [Deltaproteobacteria bacterium]
MTGDYDRAVEDYTKALEIDPNNQYIPYNIAIVYSIKNDALNACRWLRKAIKNGYDDITWLNNDKYFDNIRGTNCLQAIMDSH